ncbi:hypothetical protein ACP70R_031520 [Stipagrostis hirtigluma subsp. patula]
MALSRRRLLPHTPPADRLRHQADIDILEKLFLKSGFAQFATGEKGIDHVTGGSEVSRAGSIDLSSDLVRIIDVPIRSVFITFTIGQVFVKPAADHIFVKLAAGHVFINLATGLVFIKLTVDDAFIELAAGHIFVKLTIDYVFIELATGHVFVKLATGQVIFVKFVGSQVVQVLQLVARDAWRPTPRRLGRVSLSSAPCAKLATEHHVSVRLLSQLVVESSEHIAISVYAPLKLVFGSTGGFLDWWIVTTVSVNLEQHALSSQSLVLQCFWSSRAVLMVGVLRASRCLILGNGDTISLLHYQRKFAAQQLCKLFENQAKVALISVLNYILNLRSSHGHVDAFVRSITVHRR